MVGQKTGIRDFVVRQSNTGLDKQEGLWEKFSLSEQESQKVDLVSTTTQPKSFLAAKFLTRRALNAESVARTFKPLWRTDHGFTIRDMNDNKLVFVFEDEADRERVMLGEPWVYDKFLVILQRIEEDEAIEEVAFAETSFWVQLHGIPVRRMNPEVAIILGSSLGKIAHVTEGEKAAGSGQAMRIRVSIDITKPLCRGRKAMLEKGREVWISFKYERLPNFCYWCGLVSHSDKDCPHWLRNQEKLQLEDQQFGPWLRASNERPWRKTEIKIEGIQKPSHSKQPTQPPSTPVNTTLTQTQSNSDPFLHNTTIPTSPSIHTPLNHQFPEPPSSKIISSPPPSAAVPVAHPPPNQDDHPTYMDLEENPGFTSQLSIGGGCNAVPPSAMNCLAWNCRGLGNPRTVQEIARLVRAQDPSVVFLIETWQDEGPLERLRCQLQFENKFIAQSRNKGGGLCLLWKKEINLRVYSFSHSHIDAVVNENQPDAWRFTGFYGAPETHNREESWNLLRRLNAQFKLPWCCMGDFNELVRIEEKQGRHARSERQMQLFRDVLDECSFMDLGFTGPRFTWTNNRPADMTWERLDRVVATPDWLLQFPSAQVHHLEGRWSDHKPVWMTTEPTFIPSKKPFRFEEVWTSDQGCEAVVQDSWKKEAAGVPMEVERLLKQAEEVSMQGRDHHRVSLLRQELHSLLAKEEEIMETAFPGRLTANPEQIDEVLDNIQMVVTEEMNNQLIKEFTAEEVDVALKQMAPLKAPGPDGLPPIFYQHYWHLIGKDVTTAVLTCLNSGKILKAINHTYITLIPKVQNPEEVVEFRPISLCNVIYKIISKVLANRLKILLPTIVSESQSAFIPGRLITDNILVAFETLHHMQHQKTGKLGSMALKLDMSKAYDRVEWRYLKGVMEKMGFHKKWVTILMECVSTVSYSILVNEDFHALIEKEKIAGTLQGVSISRGGPKISHLFFADDSLLFCKATTTDVTRIQDILSQYEKASGREILIKSVAQAIPAYAMSCFRLPNRLIKEIEILIRRFWWGQNGEKGKMHWLPWPTLCKPKCDGGIGLRDLGFFNEALLAKQVWRLLHNPSSLFFKVFKAKYFSRCSIFEVQQSTKGSYAWRSILSARDLITKGSVWRIGTGKDIHIWRDKWLIGSNNQRIISTPPLHTSISHVEHLIDSDLKSWKTELVKDLFLPHEATIILGIPLSFRNPADSLIWGATKQGIYTVRSGYHLLLHERNQAEPGTSDTTRMSQLWKTIWSVQIPSKIRHFLWRACHSSLPTRSNLHHRHVLDDPRCNSCTDQIESTIHTLWQCKSIAPIWHSISWGQTLSKIAYTDCIDLIYQCTQTLSTNELQLFAVICWSIWYRRNRLRLQQPADTNTQLVRRARETLLEFHAAQDRGKQRSMQPNSTTVIKWKPPEVSRFKVNYDGAVFSDRNEAGIGVIIRNHRGEVMGALSQ
uniref:Reverse transcriptase domain-containing protein n=1 Tax=Fagus sylvatica TaxID=28930 RepID=A0A2N9G7B6_FAGSY